MKRTVLAKTITLALISVFLLQPISTTSTQERVSSDIYARILKEETDNSQIMRTLHFFSDVYGPRLTGSPNLKAAGEWAVRQMQSWGFENAHLEPWNFGHPGWVNERAAGFIVAPVKDSLVFEVLAWTPGTNGTVVSQAFHMMMPERPTQEELTAYFEKVKPQVAGKIVLVGRHTPVPVAFTTPSKRLNDEDLRTRFDPNARPSPTPSPTPTPTPTQRLTGTQVSEQLDKFLLENRVLVRVNDAGREGGQIRAFNNRSFDVNSAVPTVILRNEDYGRISRLMAGGQAVTLEFNIQNRSYPEGATAYNVIAEIPGTDKRDEVIMLGGHLDSWHAATGATDNAIGCAVMMEAARILKAIGVRPRRTIRVALWSGEEQGLLGSLAYVKEHFGTFENPKPEYFKFGGYFNIDSGTGRARGMTVFGPPTASAPLREAVGPLAYLGIVGVANTRNRALGGSDNTSFNQAGLPGISILQDPVEYFTQTWHTNLDTYERIIEDDARRSAVIIAAAVYQLAMRDELLPRFGQGEMPPLPRASPQPSPTPVPSGTPPAQ